MSTDVLLAGLRAAIVEGDEEAAERLATAALAAGIDPLRAIEDALRPGITEVGEGFACGDYFLPDLVISAQAMKRATAILEREIARTGGDQSRRLGKVVLGTVEGDLHDIGKTIVGTLLSAHGFEVVDLGVNVTRDTFVAAVRDHRPDILGMSSLLTLTAKELRKVTDALTEAGLRDSVKVMVGGGAVTKEFAESIGADGFAHDAEIGVRVARRLLALD
jgi:corrinoid protein of di/trimethylamine methyltransferase